jgi:hypothetical protein
MGAGMRPFSTMQIVIIWIINNVFEYILCITDGISWMEVVYIYSTTSMSLFYVHCHAGNKISQCKFKFHILGLLVTKIWIRIRNMNSSYQSV